MALIPLQLPPGVYRNGTELQSAGRWYDANLVRWFEGVMRPIGGWQKRIDTAVSGMPRTVLPWSDTTGDRWIAIGTHSKLYVLSAVGQLKEITPSGFLTGYVNPTINYGYGAGPYGLEAYGVARRDFGSPQDATTWSMDTWGGYLIACSSHDKKIYEWQLGFSSPTLAAQIANSPENCKGILVTAERFLFALGADGDSRKIAWCDQEDNTDWTPTPLNQAGDFTISSQGDIMAGKRFRGLNLIWTNVDLHTAQYVGQPFVYGFEKVGSGCGLISKQSAIVTDNSAIWMGPAGFFTFDGYVRPLQSDVSEYVFRDMNESQSSKIVAMHNSKFGEVWWYYPSEDSNENNRYVAYNYRENHWTIGALSRTACADSGAFRNPIMLDPNGYIYDHEIGVITDQPVYAETGPVQIGVGDNIMMAREMIPDELNVGEVQISFATKFYPNTTEYSHGPYSLTSPTSVRFTGRQVKMKIEQVVADQWRVGITKLDVVPGGRR